MDRLSGGRISRARAYIQSIHDIGRGGGSEQEDLFIRPLEKNGKGTCDAFFQRRTQIGKGCAWQYGRNGRSSVFVQGARGIDGKENKPTERE